MFLSLADASRLRTRDTSISIAAAAHYHVFERRARHRPPPALAHELVELGGASHQFRQLLHGVVGVSEHAYVSVVAVIEEAKAGGIGCGGNTAA